MHTILAGSAGAGNEMAREESDREDLIREATGLVDRVEYQVDFVTEPVVVGFRRDGSISLFFGQARVYQFNREGELRRGYLDGHLLKAERRRLVQLTRHRDEAQVQLVRRDLSESEHDDFLADAMSHIRQLQTHVGGDKAAVLRSVSSQDATMTAEDRVKEWLARWPGEIKIATTPRLTTPKRQK